jgi:hypothetical protein
MERDVTQSERTVNERRWRLPQPALTAALLALVLAIVGAQLYPAFSSGRWLDGMLNQWLIVFTVCYVGLVVLQGVVERLPIELRLLRASLSRLDRLGSRS